MSQLVRAGISLEIPANVSSSDSWQILNDDLRRKKVPILSCDDGQFLHYFVTLSIIVSEMIFMFYAPTDRMNSAKVINFYYKYQTWYRQLPKSLLLTDRTAPHVFILQYVILTRFMDTC